MSVNNGQMETAWTTINVCVSKVLYYKGYIAIFRSWEAGKMLLFNLKQYFILKQYTLNMINSNDSIDSIDITDSLILLIVSYLR